MRFLSLRLGHQHIFKTPFSTIRRKTSSNLDSWHPLPRFFGCLKEEGVLRGDEHLPPVWREWLWGFALFRIVWWWQLECAVNCTSTLTRHFLPPSTEPETDGLWHLPFWPFSRQKNVIVFRLGIGLISHDCFVSLLGIPWVCWLWVIFQKKKKKIIS